MTDMQDDWKIMTACQEVTGANPKKMYPNPGEKETVMGRREVPNEETSIHSLRACRRETMACQEMTEAHLECNEPNSAVA
jgi:hypothetical protein